MSDDAALGYTLFAILAGPRPRGAAPTTADLDALTAATAALPADGVTLRGLYDVTGMRADADLMVWLHGEDPVALQRALRALRRTSVLADFENIWSAMGVHREAEDEATMRRLRAAARARSEQFGERAFSERWAVVWERVRRLSRVEAEPRR